jgi:SAM-dependent methyltransferase
MTRYPDIANPALLERIPFAARSMLDVGCGSGALGAAYRRLNPTARLYGIELDPDAAAIAASRLDHVAIVDVERDPLPFEVPSGFDCVVYGDVLEHLRDPFAVLRAQAELLTDDGIVLISIPNVEHWSFAARLLSGTFDYDESGLFDRTHLRWFSLETMRRGLIDCGLVPVDAIPRIFDADKAHAFAAAVAPALAALQIDPKAYARRAAPLQYLWRLRRRAARPLLVAASMMEHVGGVSHVRILDPMRAIGTDPDISVHVAQTGQLPQAALDAPKLFILHRPILVGPEGLAIIRTLLAQNWLIVTEFDDHPDFFAPLQRPDMYVFRSVHAVQTSTEPLATTLRERNPEVAVFRNAIHTLPDVRNFADPRHLTLFFGGLNREADWAPLLDALNAVAGTVGDRLFFRIVHDRTLFDALATPYKGFTPTCDYQTYLELLGQSEISFMPLNDTWFNRCKSDLKFIEAAACRVAALASPVVYADSIESGRTGVLFGDAEELYTSLLRLVAHPDAARRIGDAARQWVAENRMLAYQTKARIDWYRSLCERRDELTRALLERTPELGEAVEID